MYRGKDRKMLAEDSRHSLSLKSCAQFLERHGFSSGLISIGNLFDIIYFLVLLCGVTSNITTLRGTSSVGTELCKSRFLIPFHVIININVYEYIFYKFYNNFPFAHVLDWKRWTWWNRLRLGSKD